MKKTLLILISIISLAGCSSLGTDGVFPHIDQIQETVVSDGPMTTLAYPISEITRLNINNGYELVYKQGSEMSVTVEIDRRHKDHVLVGYNKYHRDELIITRKKQAWDLRYPEKVTVTLPYVSSLDFSGEARWTGGEIRQEQPLEIEMSIESSNIVNAEVIVPTLIVRCSMDSGNLNLRGETAKAIVNVSVGQSLNLSQMKIRELTLDVSMNGTFTGVAAGPSRIEGSMGSMINLTQSEGKVYADLSSTAKLNLTGNAAIIPFED